MSYPVIIFSVDNLRGGLTKKILKRNGFEALLLSKIIGIRDTIVRHAPGVVIFDTFGCFSEEKKQIRSLCQGLESISVIVLGDPSIMEVFDGPSISKERYLSDPLDPELIVSTVKDILISKAKEKRSKSDALVSDLKHFLKLD